MRLWDKTIYLNNFNSDVLYGEIEGSLLAFEYNWDGKGGMSNPKYISN